MTAVTQGYMSPDIHDPNRALFAAIGPGEKTNNNPFGSFGKNINPMGHSGGRMMQHLDTQQQQRSNEHARGFTDDMASFFDFEPQTNPGSPFLPQSPANNMLNTGNGWNTMSFEPLSPPDSAIFAPEEWPPYQFQPRQPQSIVTDIYPKDTRVQYGQTTPPDDEDTSMFENEHEPQWQAQPALVSSDTKKRKRASAAAILPPKRIRKNTARLNLAKSLNTPSGDPNNPEDVRRSKFLERNRVAASKCRQKKKEWTSNLETRARDLQKNNSSLRMMLGSLKDEVLFLKGEMLKHTSCGCDQIQSFLRKRADDFSDQHEETFKKEQSPIGTAPTSRHGSFSTGSDRATNDDAISPTASGSPPSMNPEGQGLETLLRSQPVHDTSDEGIAQRVSAA